MTVRPPQIVYGVFKGMGDLLWATPVIVNELSRGVEVHLLLFPSAALADFCSLIDFGPGRRRLYVHRLPRTARQAFALLRQLGRLEPNFIWVSPHAPRIDASWKIPLALWALKKLCWRRAELVGASSEKYSRLFGTRISIDRRLPLRLREWAMYTLFRDGAVPAPPPPPRFIDTIATRSEEPPTFDLVIHPGATARNRIWLPAKYLEVVERLPRTWKIGVVGLPEDLEPLRQILPSERSIEYITGSLELSLVTIASAGVMLVVDSGNMHFAEVLHRPTVAIFGKDDPTTVVVPGMIEPVYEKSMECQPCARTHCRQTEVFCLNNLSAVIVADRLVAAAHRTTLANDRPSHLVSITVP